MIELCGTLEEKSKVKLIQKAQLLSEENDRNSVNSNFK
jgi:hypothetical protein